VPWYDNRRHNFGHDDSFTNDGWRAGLYAELLTLRQKGGVPCAKD